MPEVECDGGQQSRRSTRPEVNKAGGQVPPPRVPDLWPSERKAGYKYSVALAAEDAPCAE